MKVAPNKMNSLFMTTTFCQQKYLFILVIQNCTQNVRSGGKVKVRLRRKTGLSHEGNIRKCQIVALISLLVVGYFNRERKKIRRVFNRFSGPLTFTHHWTGALSKYNNL